MADTVWGDVPLEVPSFNIADKPPVVEPQGATEEADFKGLPVRAGGDMIFLLRNGKRAWVTSAEVFSKLGFKFGDEVKIDQATLNVIPEGEPLR
jgi:hypothetical protein